MPPLADKSPGVLCAFALLLFAAIRTSAGDEGTKEWSAWAAAHPNYSAEVSATQGRYASNNAIWQWIEGDGQVECIVSTQTNYPFPHQYYSRLHRGVLYAYFPDSALYVPVVDHAIADSIQSAFEHLERSLRKKDAPTPGGSSRGRDLQIAMDLSAFRYLGVVPLGRTPAALTLELRKDGSPVSACIGGLENPIKLHFHFRTFDLEEVLKTVPRLPPVGETLLRDNVTFDEAYAQYLDLKNAEIKKLAALELPEK